MIKANKYGHKLLMWSLFALSLFLAAEGASATPMVYDFDTFADSTAITNQLAGMTFSNTIVLTGALNLNSFEFPPFSGDGVVSDDGGPISIAFSAPVFSVGGSTSFSCLMKNAGEK